MLTFDLAFLLISPCDSAYKEHHNWITLLMIEIEHYAA